LTRHGVSVLHDEAVAVDADRREVKLAAGKPLSYDRLIVAPGVAFMYGDIPGLNSAEPKRRWCTRGKPVRRRHPEKTARGNARRRSLCSRHSEGAVPLPAGPYERACQVAHYFKAGQAEIQSADPRWQRGRDIQEGHLHGSLERTVQGAGRVPCELRG